MPPRRPRPSPCCYPSPSCCCWPTASGASAARAADRRPPRVAAPAGAASHRAPRAGPLVVYWAGHDWSHRPSPGAPPHVLARVRPHGGLLAVLALAALLRLIPLALILANGGHPLIGDEGNYV